MSQAEEPEEELKKGPKEPDDKRQGWIPRPPQSTSATDFIVIVFAVTVAAILLILTIGTVIAGILGADIKSYFAILTSIVTSVISALVGYLAGKNSQGPPEGGPPKAMS